MQIYGRTQFSLLFRTVMTVKMMMMMMMMVVVAKRFRSSGSEGPSATQAG